MWIAHKQRLTPITAMFIHAALLVGCDDASVSQHLSDITTTAYRTEQSSASPWFEEVAQQRGIQWNWNAGHQSRFYQPEIIGGGAALFDYNNDGWLDLYLVQAGSIDHPQSNPSNVLMRNVGSGVFEEVLNAAGADDRAYGMGAACGDFNNDGHIDLYVTNLGPNVLYRNNGDGTFTNITATAAVGHPAWSSSAAFVDFNRDGWLDLFVCNYINWSPVVERDCYSVAGTPDYCAPHVYAAPTMDTLYHNNANGGFTDVTLQAGLDSAFGPGLGVVCFDFDHDGWIDIFVANDGMPNQLWLNRGNGTFTNFALPLGCGVDEEGKAKAGMGVDSSDYDNDGDFDILICNLRLESDSLFANEGTHFTDMTARAKLRVPTRPFTGFGVGWIDFNNDGVLDIYQSHGLVGIDSGVSREDDPYAQPNLLFEGLPDNTYAEVLPRGGTQALLDHTSRAAVFGDVDNDGGIDVVVINRNAPAYLLRNVVQNRGNWLSLRVLEHGRDAYGAVVTASIGERRVMRPVRAACGYMASHDPRVHLGLADQTTVEAIQVRWIDGFVEEFGPFDANQFFTIERGKGRPAK